MSFFPFQSMANSNSTAAHLPLLGVNIDHVATLRNARGGVDPDPVALACTAVEAGADIITFHLREDRRHINDDDVKRLREHVKVPLNFEAAMTDEMLEIIERTQPDHVCIVPENRQEITTEGGLDVHSQLPRLQQVCARLSQAGCRVSLFISTDANQIVASAKTGALCIEFHTGRLAQAWWRQDIAAIEQEMQRLNVGIQHASALGLRIHAGHGLALSAQLISSLGHASSDCVSSSAMVAALHDVMELHIGHALIARTLWVGMAQAVREFKTEIMRARRS